ncbi:ATPase family associated with various cellular activities (AAA) [Chitinophaga jiangningensis]|uniref:ATPase family associated with various cellular activities (AAA) n=1 Tax=Chitinophaga jiangningensis TaxID=1419482 RepID=A0A1M7AAX5_9BACT|nr:ATP-binding protein [Chitinophaga jiangningensis]SHL39818.1 ATPase family associated with various cellular activities (AAA) [Chitinophaga jiangningensis]
MEQVMTANNSRSTLVYYFNYFEKYVSAAFARHFHGEDYAVNIPAWKHAAFGDRQLSQAETIVLLCALAPHLQAGCFDRLIQQYLPEGGEFASFGGVKGSNTRYMLPTGDTALFLLAGEDAAAREPYFSLFSTSHWFWKEGVLWLETVKEGEPRSSGRLILSAEIVELLLEGRQHAPAFGPEFPAKQLETAQHWDDLVLNANTLDQINDVRAWLHYHERALKDPVLGRKAKPGYRALFYGGSGTGKTLAATLLGKELQRDVYRIDLSQVVSKYIGETEKNLEKIFTKAAHRNWMLFFDEADSLFGKRSSVQSANDKYANQEVSYLLQRVEDFPGLVILATNYKSNIDAAFLRRFNAIIEFPLPEPGEREMLWQKAMPADIRVDETVNLAQLAARYPVSGATINQVVYYAVLQYYHRHLPAISQELLIAGVQRELRKEDKLLR